MIFVNYDEAKAIRASNLLLNGEAIGGDALNALVAYIAMLMDIAADPRKHFVEPLTPPMFPTTPFGFSLVPVLGIAASVTRYGWEDDARTTAFLAGGWVLRRLRKERTFENMTTGIEVPVANAALVGAAEDAAAGPWLFGRGMFRFDRSVGQDIRVALTALRSVPGPAIDSAAIEAASWLSDQRVRSERIELATTFGTIVAVTTLAMAAGGLFSRKERRASTPDSASVGPLRFAPFGGALLDPFSPPILQ